MLTDLGTRTQTINLGSGSIQVPVPGFNRFFDDDNKEGIDARLRTLVFGPKSRNRGTSTGVGVDAQGNPTQGAAFPLRVLPTEWTDPANAGTNAPIMSQFSTAGEYTFYQAESLLSARAAHAGEDRQAERAGAAPPAASSSTFHRHRLRRITTSIRSSRRSPTIPDCFARSAW